MRSRSAFFGLAHGVLLRAEMIRDRMEQIRKALRRDLGFRLEDISKPLAGKFVTRVDHDKNSTTGSMAGLIAAVWISFRPLGD
jgi:hypothetical protein